MGQCLEPRRPGQGSQGQVLQVIQVVVRLEPRDKVQALSSDTEASKV